MVLILSMLLVDMGATGCCQISTIRHCLPWFAIVSLDVGGCNELAAGKLFKGMFKAGHDTPLNTLETLDSTLTITAVGIICLPF